MARDKDKGRLLEFAEGLAIIAEYCKDGFACQAEHDVFYAGNEEAYQAITPGVLAALDDLGWRWDRGVGAFRKFT